MWSLVSLACDQALFHWSWNQNWVKVKPRNSVSFLLFAFIVIIIFSLSFFLTCRSLSNCTESAVVGEELISVKRGVKGFMWVYRSGWLWWHRALRYLIFLTSCHTHSPITLTSDLPPTHLWSKMIDSEKMCVFVYAWVWTKTPLSSN